MADPYRYFRIEARELTETLSLALAQLAQDASPAGQAGLLLRHAHTLKGAARVVSLPRIAELAHQLEELAEPYRRTSNQVPPAVLDQLQATVGSITSELDTLPHSVPAAETLASADTLGDGSTFTAERTVTAESQLGAGATGSGEPLHQTARVWLSEIDEVISGVAEAMTQVRGLLDCSAELARLKSALAERAGLGRQAVVLKVARLQRAADDLQRSLSGCADRIDRELREVHHVAEQLRLVPVESIFHDLELAARDVAREQGKSVRIDLAGGQVRLDAPVLSAAQVALRQIVRNAVAHGIETPSDRVAAGKSAEGTVAIQVSQTGAQLTFRCTDDGRGIDLDSVREQLHRAGHAAGAGPPERVLESLMHGGFSTAASLSQLAGRGIGLDVVRDAAERLGGRLRITTSRGSGTTIELSALGSLIARQVLLAEAGSPARTVAIPLSAVRTTLRIRAGQISRGPSGESLAHQGEALAFRPLAEVLDAASTGPGGQPGNETGINAMADRAGGPARARTGAAAGSRSEPAWTVLILDDSSGQAALGVNRLLATADVAIHPVPEIAPATPVVSGVWLDSDGQPRLVLDPAALIAAARADRPMNQPGTAAVAPILVVDDSLTTRMLEQSILRAAGYQVELAVSAEEGLMLAASRPYSLALVDVEMPGMDGFGFVEQARIRPQLRGLPCVLVTTRASEDDRRRGEQVGARGLINKGEFDQDQLLALIAKLTSQAES